MREPTMTYTVTLTHDELLATAVALVYLFEGNKTETAKSKSTARVVYDRLMSAQFGDFSF